MNQLNYYRHFYALIICQWPGRPGFNPWSSHTKDSKKWYLMPPCIMFILNALSIIRYGSRVKWSSPGKEVVPSPTPWCSSYRKGSLWVTLDFTLLFIKGTWHCWWKDRIQNILHVKNIDMISFIPPFITFKKYSCTLYWSFCLTSEMTCFAIWWFSTRVKLC